MKIKTVISNDEETKEYGGIEGRHFWPKKNYGFTREELLKIADAMPSSGRKRKPFTKRKKAVMSLIGRVRATGLNQKDFAELAGVSQTTIHNLLSGKTKKPTPSILAKIEETLKGLGA